MQPLIASKWYKLTRGKSVGELQFNSFLVHCPYPQIQGALWIDTWPCSHATANRLNETRENHKTHDEGQNLWFPSSWPEPERDAGYGVGTYKPSWADRSGQSVTRTTHFLPQIENLKRLPDHEDHITVLSCYLWDVSTKILLNQRRVNIGQILLTLKVRCALCRHAVSTESWFSFIRRQVKRKRLDISRYKLDSQ